MSQVELGCPPRACVRLYVAETFVQRLIGLAALSRLPSGSGLLIPRCRSVHTFGMRFAIDVVFVTWPARERTARVLAVRAVVPRRRLVSCALGARSAAAQIAAIELASGEARRLRIEPGGPLHLRPSSGGAPLTTLPGRMFEGSERPH